MRVQPSLPGSGSEALSWRLRDLLRGVRGSGRGLVGDDGSTREKAEEQFEETDRYPWNFSVVWVSGHKMAESLDHARGSAVTYP